MKCKATIWPICRCCSRNSKPWRKWKRRLSKWVTNWSRKEKETNISLTNFQKCKLKWTKVQIHRDIYTKKWKKWTILCIKKISSCLEKVESSLPSKNSCKRWINKISNCRWKGQNLRQAWKKWERHINTRLSRLSWWSRSRRREWSNLWTKVLAIYRFDTKGRRKSVKWKQG